MNKKIITLLISSLFLLNSYAQDETETNLTTQGGTFTGNLTIAMKVPQLCNITTKNYTVNGYEYLKAASSHNLRLYLDCKGGSIIKFGFNLGSNPNSTPEKRRLPLNGEQGDAKHYLEYQVRYGSFVIGDLTKAYTYTTSSYLSSLDFNVFFPANQTNLVVGDYKDTITFDIEYY